ncbi:serine hydroxymethyltransferase [Candidatus Micrarchaeota archaeon]|nr:serine hydroxymethyltransferase [Candidatus Micrarchaeota archaeon]
MFFLSSLSKTDPEVARIVSSEVKRQQTQLGMIASENYCSLAVLEANGSVLQNKYSEGYPGKRYYAGNKFIDEVESLCIERAKKLFGVEHANVQPNAGSAANMAAYMALLELGDKFMGLSLSLGGHLTHGSPYNFSGKWYKVSPYALDEKTETLDYDAIRKLAIQEKPKLIECGYTAYPRVIDFKAFREICDEVGAFLMADIAHIAGLVAGGAHPSPVPFADVVTTTTHKTLRGPRSAIIMCREVHAKAVDKAVFPGLQGGPLEHSIAAKAVCFHEALQPSFKDYAKQVVKNCKVLAGELMSLGCKLVSDGTDNHLLLIDLTGRTITGKDAQDRLESVGIVCNKNTVPKETRSPFIASGVRLGSACLTTRGMRESEMKEVARLIVDTIDKFDETKAKTSARVLELAKQFPVYPELK